VKRIFFIALITIGGMFAMASLVFGTGLGLTEVNENKSTSLEGIEEIQLTMTSENIHIYKVDTDDEIRFHYYGRSFPARELVLESVNGKIFVMPDAKYWLGNLKLDIYLPVNYKHAISIKNSSGDVSFEAVDLALFSMETTSGNFSADTLKASSVSIKSTSGAMDVKSIVAASLQVSTQSGNVIFSNCMVNDFSIKSSSADILLNNITGNVDIKTTSGKVNLMYPEFDKNKVKVVTTSGEISVNVPLDAGFSLDAHTTSGTIHSDYPLLKTEKHAASGQIGSGEGQIILSATSGNIRLTINN
jgi:lia operon protein LiaG